ncbi:MAG TPA: hypothetical protein ENI67_07695 [Gammaproteobacteria bacterium]|nr:hypothetical protein [Gammaproteobacteria bacterium]
MSIALHDSSRSMLGNILYLLIVVLMVGGVFTDFISTWLHFHNSTFWRISLVFRAGMGVDLTVILLMGMQRWPNYAIWLLAACSVSTILLWLGYASTPSADMGNYLETTFHLYKMIYPILLFVGLRILLQDHPFLTRRLFTVLDIILVVYLLFIFVGLLTGNDMFRTYWSGFRPGFKGIIMTQNEATGTVMVAIFWFGLRYFSRERHILFFAVSILAALVLGTKGALLACVPLVGGMLWARYGMIKMLPPFVLLVAVFSVLSLFAYQYSETVHAGVTLFSNYMAEHLSSDSTRGIIDLLTSGRSDRLESLLPTLANTFSPLFLVSGMPIAYRSIEIDPVDAFLRGGLLFLVLLLVAYWKIFFFSGGSGGKRYKLVLFTIWMGIAFTGGHLWMASTTAPMLIIALAYAGRMEPLGKKVYVARRKPKIPSFNNSSFGVQNQRINIDNQLDLRLKGPPTW